MTQDEIIRMATEVWGYADWKGAPLERLERFAALVATHEREKQAEQEPVAWLYRGELHWENPSEWAKGEVTPLYTDIPQSNTEQHPIARVPAHPEQGLEWLQPPPVWGTLLYAAPVRTKDLTDDEIMDLVRDECVDMRWPSTPLFIARAVIAADREKNK